VLSFSVVFVAYQYIVKKKIEKEISKKEEEKTLIRLEFAIYLHILAVFSFGLHL
jgi:low temperature requirement protein LtrA